MTFGKYICVLFILFSVHLTLLQGKSLRNPTKVADQLFVPEIPEECEGIGICEDVPNYPTDHVTKIVKMLKSKKKLEVRTANVSEHMEENTHLKEGLDLELCQSTTRDFVPKAARSDEGKWYFILNQGDTFRQTFKSVICRTQGSCSNFVQFYGKHSGRCLQKFVMLDMNTVSETGILVTKRVPIPSCCSCVAMTIK